MISTAHASFRATGTPQADPRARTTAQLRQQVWLQGLSTLPTPISFLALSLRQFLSLLISFPHCCFLFRTFEASPLLMFSSYFSLFLNSLQHGNGADALFGLSAVPTLTSLYSSSYGTSPASSTQRSFDRNSAKWLPEPIDVLRGCSYCFVSELMLELLLVPCLVFWCWCICVGDEVYEHT